MASLNINGIIIVYTWEEHRGGFELWTRGRNTEGDSSSVHERGTRGDLSCVEDGGTHREIWVVYTREEHRGRFELDIRGRFELCTQGRNIEGDLSWVHEGGTQREIWVLYYIIWKKNVQFTIELCITWPSNRAVIKN